MPNLPKRNSDHAQRHNTPTIDNEAIANHLEALLTPAIFAQQKYYKQLGLRDRVLNLSLMVAAVLTFWLFYAVLVDLGDAVADELSLPFDQISLEMVYRGLYHFSVAYDKGKADDPIKYFATPENQDLGVVKYLRKPVSKLDLSPWTAPSQTLVQLP